MSSSSRAGAPYLPNINGFRGLCILLVFMHHVANSGLPPVPAPGSAWQSGLHHTFMSFAYGVEMFFMISGYVIVLSLRRHASVGQFLKDRALRIFPVWVPLVLCLCLAGALGGWRLYENVDLPHGIVIALANLFLIPPLVPIPLAHPASWSLTYEWVFYLMGALCMALSRRPALPRGTMWAWGLGAAVLMACYPRSLFFLPGVILALRPEAARRIQSTTPLAYLSLPLFLFTWYGTGIFAARYTEPLWQVLLDGHTLGVIVALLAGFHLFACVVSPSSRGLAILRTRALQHLGTISYSFYLCHPIVMFVVKRIVVRQIPDAQGSWWATIVFAVLAWLLSWLMAYLSWRWLEQGLARWLKSRGHADHPKVRRENAAGSVNER